MMVSKELPLDAEAPPLIWTTTEGDAQERRRFPCRQRIAPFPLPLDRIAACHPLTTPDDYEAAHA